MRLTDETFEEGTDRPGLLGSEQARALRLATVEEAAGTVVAQQLLDASKPVARRRIRLDCVGVANRERGRLDRRRSGEACELPEDERIGHRAAADHHEAAACLAHHATGVAGRLHAPIAADRAGRAVAPSLRGRGDPRPVRRVVVAVHATPAVDGQHGRARRGDGIDHLDQKARIRDPRPDFRGHGQLRRGHGLGHDPLHERRIGQQG